MGIPSLFARLTSVRAVPVVYFIVCLAAASFGRWPDVISGEIFFEPAPTRSEFGSTSLPHFRPLSRGQLGLTCIPLSSSMSYTQDFDTLAISGTMNTSVPTGWLFSESGTNPNSLYAASTGSSTTGDTYSLGPSGNTDRAFGGLQTASLLPTVGACFLNNTGGTISALNITYDGEQWRLGALNRTDRLDFEYSLDATSLTTGTWTGVDSLDFVAPLTTGSTGAQDGNLHKVTVSSSIPNLSVANGSTIFIRYLDFGAVGADDGLGIDNFTISTSAGLPSVQLSSDSYIDDESQTLVITVERTGTGASSVDFATAGGSATPGLCSAGADYEPQAGTLAFVESESTKLLNIPLCGDLLKDPAETFNIVLSNPSNATLGPRSNGSIAINDAASQFRDPSPIIINEQGVATPYPSMLSVSGAGALYLLRVTLFDVTADLADDLDVLLVGPGGHSFVLMADAGGTNPIAAGTTITFNDLSPGFLPDSDGFTSGSYRPTSWGNALSVFPEPAPSGPYNEPGPGGTPMPRSEFMNSVFGGTNPNGIWSLYVLDDSAGPMPLAPGTIAGGWAIEVLAPSAVALTLSGRALDVSGRGIRGVVVSVQGGDLPEPRFAQTGSLGHYSFESLSGGTYLVSVFSKRHAFPVSERVITLSDNATDVDFVGQPLE